MKDFSPTTPIIETLRQAWGLVRSDMRPWLVFTQVVSFVSAGTFLLQELLVRLTGTGFLLVIFVLWPFYASLYSVSLDLLAQRFEPRRLFDGFSSLARSLGVTLIHNLISLLLFLPFYTIISFYVFSKLGWSPDQFSTPGAIQKEHVEAFMKAFTDNWPVILLIALCGWPFQIYVQSRLFVAYHQIVRLKEPVFGSLLGSLQKTSSGQARRFFIVWIAEALFPLLLPLFFITYPLKYALYGILLREVEDKTVAQPSVSDAPFPGEHPLKNPYVD